MSVKYFSEQGLARNDGRVFPWRDLRRMVHQMRRTKSGMRSVWRTEIHFKNGESAWLIPTKVSNYREVMEYVSKLPCEQAEVKV
jgi:hypothetical protein